MNIDAHQHFWIYDAGQYAWIGESMGALKRDFLPNDLWPLLRANDLRGSIAVQARQTLEETEWLLQLADEHSFIRGVVGWVDLKSEGAAGDLERLAWHPAFRGVRHVLQDETDDHFMLDPRFMHGLSLLSRFGLTYDLLIFPRHLPVACELVRMFPEQRFVLDHLAKPPIRNRRLEPWASDLRRLAAFPNVHCKLSGMVTEADWNGWKPEDFSAYLDTVLEAFGPKRLMAGSDWPVCTLAGDYKGVLRILRDYLQRLSVSERQAIWGENAEAFYSLPAATSTQA
jgi:L-fuconolactonase